jgi:hypothetical protein
MRTDIGTDCMSRLFPGNPTLFFRGGASAFSFMDVSGMAAQSARTVGANQNQIARIGCQKFAETDYVTNGTFGPYAETAGKYLLFGSVKPSVIKSWHRCCKRLSKCTLQESKTFKRLRPTNLCECPANLDRDLLCEFVFCASCP